MTGMHLDDEQVQRALHRELGPNRHQVQDHLMVCPACRGRLEQVREEEAWLFGRLEQLDHPARAVKLPRFLSPAVPRRIRERVAAGILLAFAATGLAYAAPGSPLPGLLHRAVTLLQGEPHAPPAAPSPATPTPQAGIALAPGGRLVIEFTGPLAHATALVTLGDSSLVAIRALDGATFTSEAERIVVVPQGEGGRFEIELPRSSPAVEIRAKGKLVLRQQGSGVVPPVPRNSDGSYRIELD